MRESASESRRRKEINQTLNIGIEARAFSPSTIALAKCIIHIIHIKDEIKTNPRNKKYCHECENNHMKSVARERLLQSEQK